MNKPNTTHTTQTTTFTHNNRKWQARHYINEANTAHLTRIAPTRRGRPFPTREEHRQATQHYRNNLAPHKPPQAP